MKPILATASAAAILTVLAGPAAAQIWRALAEQVLNLAAQELQANHPAMVVEDRASGPFRHVGCGRPRAHRCRWLLRAASRSPRRNSAP